MAKVSDRGYWMGNDVFPYHTVDRHLAAVLSAFFLKENSRSIVDFGCGMGDYVKIFRYFGLDCDGYDGNPNTRELSFGTCDVLDLSQPFLLDKTYSHVLSLEVGEHLPKKYEQIFLDNLVAHCEKTLVISWAIKGQGGFGHCNEQSNTYIQKQVEYRGLKRDFSLETILRKRATIPWFKKTIMTFHRKTS